MDINNNGHIDINQAKYLKHIGAINGPKVTIVIRDGHPYIRIADCEFKTYKAALTYLQHDAAKLAE